MVARLSCFLILAAALCACSFSTEKNTETQISSQVSVKTLNGYFLKNDYQFTDSIEFFVFRNAQEFERYVGIARVMGGNFDTIDFANECAVAIACPPTNRKTDIQFSSVKNENDTLIVNYTITRDDKQSYDMLPFSLLRISKQENLKEIRFVRDGEAKKIKY